MSLEESGLLAKKQEVHVPVNGYIKESAKRDKPETVEQLVKLVQQEYSLSKQEITSLLVQLQNEGKVRLGESDPAGPLTLRKYIFSPNATWFWIVAILVVSATITVFTVSEDSPIAYVRWFLGAIFVLFLPGYTLIKALFPRQPTKTSLENLGVIERVALSIGMSLALVPIVGLLLNYTPWGIRTAPITLSLLGLTVSFGIVALIREYQSKMKNTPANTSNV
jgi:hypothetical protein